MTAFEATPLAASSGDPAVSPWRRDGRFTGATGATGVFWRLQARGAVLLALTLGIYRFWLANDVRRFLWSHTELRDDSFEYTGSPFELLVGFLTAIAILIPLYVFAFAITLGMGDVAQAISTLGLPFLAFLGQFAVFRARRYRLSRTVLRSIRFHQTGSALRYAACTMVWWLLILLTLGLAYPFMAASLQRYKMRHTHYGAINGRFVGSAFGLLLRGLPMWILVAAPILIALASIVTVDWPLLMELSAEGGDVVTRVEKSCPEAIGLIALAAMAVAAAVVLAMLLFPVFQAVTMRWWVSGVQLGPVQMRSHLRIRPIYGAYLRFALLALAFLLVMAMVGLAGATFFLSLFERVAGNEAREIAAALGAVALYVATVLGLSALYQSTAKLALWREAVNTADVQGLESLTNVRAFGRPASPFGEGLADALNVGRI